VIATGTVLYAFYAPREYQATTLVLVTPQKVPEQFVSAYRDVKDRGAPPIHCPGDLEPTRLEKVISEFKLYPKEIRTGSMEEVVEGMRKNILIEIPKKERDKDKNYFSISYIGRDPLLVTMVTNKLASLLIEENLRFRELQAQGTSEFPRRRAGGDTGQTRRAGKDSHRVQASSLWESFQSSERPT